MSTKRERQRSDELDPDYDPFEEDRPRSTITKRVQPSRQAATTPTPPTRPSGPQPVTPAGNDVIRIRADEHASEDQMDEMAWVAKSGHQDHEIICVKHRRRKKFTKVSTHPRNEYREGKQGFYCHDEAQAFWAYPLRNTKRLTCQHHCAINDKIITRTVSIRSKKCGSSHAGPCVVAIENRILYGGGRPTATPAKRQTKPKESTPRKSTSPKTSSSSTRPRPHFSTQPNDNSSETLERKWSSRRSSSRSRSRSASPRRKRTKKSRAVRSTKRSQVEPMDVDDETAVKRHQKKRSRNGDGETETSQRKRRRLESHDSQRVAEAQKPVRRSRRPVQGESFSSSTTSSRSTPTARGQYDSLFSLRHFRELEHVEELIRKNKLHEALEVLQNKLAVSNAHAEASGQKTPTPERLYYFYLGIECHVGFAKCHYALSSYDSCVTICTNVLARESSILPRQRFHCLYLRAMSRKKTMKFMDAFEDFEELSKGMARYFWKFSGDDDGSPVEALCLGEGVRDDNSPSYNSYNNGQPSLVKMDPDAKNFHVILPTAPNVGQGAETMEQTMANLANFGGAIMPDDDRDTISTLSGVPDLPPFDGLIIPQQQVIPTEIPVAQLPPPVPVGLQRSGSLPTTPKHIVDSAWLHLLKPSKPNGQHPPHELVAGTRLPPTDGTTGIGFELGGGFGGLGVSGLNLGGFGGFGAPVSAFDRGLSLEKRMRGSKPAPVLQNQISAPRLVDIKLDTTQEAAEMSKLSRFDSTQDSQDPAYSAILKSKVDKDMLRVCEDLDHFCLILHLQDEHLKKLKNEEIILEDLPVISEDDLCMVIPPPIVRHILKYRECVESTLRFWNSLQELTWSRSEDDLGELLRRYKLERCAEKLVSDNRTIEDLRDDTFTSVETFRTNYEFCVKYGLTKIGPRCRFQALLKALRVTEKPLILLAHMSNALIRETSQESSDSFTHRMDVDRERTNPNADPPPFLGIPDVPQISVVERLEANVSPSSLDVNGDLPLPAGLFSDTSEK